MGKLVLKLPIKLFYYINNSANVEPFKQFVAEILAAMRLTRKEEII